MVSSQNQIILIAKKEMDKAKTDSFGTSISESVLNLELDKEVNFIFHNSTYETKFNYDDGTCSIYNKNMFQNEIKVKKISAENALSLSKNHIKSLFLMHCLNCHKELNTFGMINGEAEGYICIHCNLEISRKETAVPDERYAADENIRIEKKREHLEKEKQHFTEFFADVKDYKICDQCKCETLKEKWEDFGRSSETTVFCFSCGYKNVSRGYGTEW